MKVLIPSKVARIIFALVLFAFGIMHFAFAERMSQMVGVKALQGVVGVYISGVALILAAIAFILKKQERLAGYLLALLLIIFILVVHIPAMSTDDMAMGLILRDIALAMSAIYIANTGE